MHKIHVYIHTERGKMRALKRTRAALSFSLSLSLSLSLSVSLSLLKDSLSLTLSRIKKDACRTLFLLPPLRNLREVELPLHVYIYS